MKYAPLTLLLLAACSSSVTADADHVACGSSAECAAGETCFGGVCGASMQSPGVLTLPAAGLIDVDFTGATLPANVVFARDTSATTVDGDTLVTRAANTPRLERSQRFGAPRGMVIEPAAENLCFGSEQLDDATWWWSARTARQGDAAIAPDHTTTATRLTAADSYEYHSTGQPFWTTDAQAYTFSMFLKAGELDQVYVGLGNPAGYPVQLFYLTQGTLSQNNGANTISNAGIIDVGGGWYRTWVVFTNGALGQNLNTILELGLLQPDASRGLYAWGCQLEVGSTVTSYTRAGAESGKRAADDVRIEHPEQLDMGRDFTILVMQAVDSNARAESVGISLAIANGDELRLGRRTEGNGVLMVTHANGEVPVYLAVGEVWRVDEPHAVVVSKSGVDLTFVDNGTVSRGAYGDLTSPAPATAIRIGQRIATPTAPARVYRVVIWQRAFDEETLVRMTAP